MPKGHEIIHGYLKTLDSSPGVYRMLDDQSRVLYVGKARNLKARVSSYARPTGHSRRIARMISETASMMFLTTRTETEALLLEQNLIKQLKPKFNVLLRDDKSFPNILVTDHAFPMIKKHRGAKKEKGAYYGPFASAGAVNRVLNQLQKAFLLRNCTDSMFETRTRPCLQYQIKRCTAPCVGKISEEDYARSVKDAQCYLSGKSTEVQERLKTQMAEASEAMEFERAAALRDRIRALTQVQTAQGINPQTTAEADVIALYLENGQACVQVFFIRANQNWGNRDFYPRVGEDVGAAEVMEAFLVKYDDIDGVYAGDDNMGVGALNAAKAAGRAGDIIFVGATNFSVGYEAMEAGEYWGSIYQSPVDDAKAALQTAIDILGGKELPFLNYFDTPKITQDNMAEFDKPVF